MRARELLARELVANAKEIVATARASGNSKRAFSIR